MKKTLLIFSIAFCLNTNAQTLCFNPATTYTTSSNPYSVCSADFNGDSKIDLAVVNYSVKNVSILLGTGTGTFGIPTNYATGGGPNSVTSADFNGDGKADLATANYDSNNVSILLGTGTGSFGLNTNFPVGTKPSSVISSDFNGDGKKDLAVANSVSNNISILLGTGTGNFGTATNFAVGANTLPHSICSADFNGDGKKDLVTANYGTSGFGTTVSVFLGTGTGSFGAAASFGVGSGPSSVTSVDFNGDGKADLAVANLGSSNVSILLGTGTGSFASATNFSVGPGGTGPYSVINGDFNLDGKIDLATANNGYLSIGVILGTGTGSFGIVTQFSIGPPKSVISADFNGDGKADLATENIGVLLNCTVLGITNFSNEQEQITVYPNPSNGSFVIQTNATTQQTVQVYDVNGKVILTQSINGTTTIDASKLNEGIYNVCITSNRGIINKKIVVIK